MLSEVSPYGFVFVTVKVKREGGREREAEWWGRAPEEEEGYLIRERSL